MIICGFVLQLQLKTQNSKPKVKFQGMFVQIIIIHTIALLLLYILLKHADHSFRVHAKAAKPNRFIRNKERITCEYNNKAVVKVGVYLLEHTVLQNVFYIHLRFYMAITNCIEMKWFKSHWFLWLLFISVLMLIVDDIIFLLLLLSFEIRPNNDKLHQLKYSQATKKKPRNIKRNPNESEKENENKLKIEHVSK